MTSSSNRKRYMTPQQAIMQTYVDETEGTREQIEKKRKLIHTKTTEIDQLTQEVKTLESDLLKIDYRFNREQDERDAKEEAVKAAKRLADPKAEAMRLAKGMKDKICEFCYKYGHPFGSVKQLAEHLLDAHRECKACGVIESEDHFDGNHVCPAKKNDETV